MSESGGSVGTDSLVVDAPRRGALARSVKALALAAATLAILPRLVIYAVSSRVFGSESAFAAASEGLGRVPGRRGLYMRQAFYRRTLDACGDDVHFGFLTVFSKPQARIGDRVYFGRACGVGWAEIGTSAMLADGVQILSGARQHQRSSDERIPHQDRPQEFRRVRVGDGAWIGTGAIIMADVGERTVVGAGAVVTAALPSDRTAVGVPARIVETG